MGLVHALFNHEIHCSLLCCVVLSLCSRCRGVIGGDCAHGGKSGRRECGID